MHRIPAVADMFYPGDRERLRNTLKSLIPERREKRDAIGIICPHAGYIYSGEVAGNVYSRISVPDCAVILCPNHTGRGQAVSIMKEGHWKMPLGDVNINSPICESIIKNSKFVKDDIKAHISEHSLEVQLPFLQYLNPNIKIVPICIMMATYDECVEIGGTIARATRDAKENVIIVASTDMTHYESHETAKKKDSMAIKMIESLDAKGLIDVVRKNNISMCGVIPTAIAIIASKDLGAKKGELVEYATSGDKSGDYYRVVGYAGMILNSKSE